MTLKNTTSQPETRSPYTAITHVGFAVADLDRSVAFYTSVLCEPPYFRQIYEVEYLGEIVGYPGCRMDCAFFRLPGTETFLEFVQYLDPPSSTVDMETYNVGNGHLCLQVGDLASDFERLQALGAVFQSAGPVEVTFGPLKGAKVAYCRDLDGITIELIESPSD
jgi:catechol 2,3-dioxygenase-like lactoylglutathione lyase family enzyme